MSIPHSAALTDDVSAGEQGGGGMEMVARALSSRAVAVSTAPVCAILRPTAFMGASCTQSGYDGAVSKVIQIRDVPDEVRDALAEAAQAEGLSLTRYVRRELVHLARRARTVRENAAILRQTQEQVGRGVDRNTILSALHDGRER